MHQMINLGQSYENDPLIPVRVRSIRPRLVNSMGKRCDRETYRNASDEEKR